MFAPQTTILRRLPRTLAASDTIRFVLVCMIGAALVAGLALAGQFISQRAAARRASDQHVLVVARNQQVLSQRIVGGVQQLLAAAPGADRRRAASELDELVRQLDRAHYGLRAGDPALGLPASDSELVGSILADLHPKYIGVSQGASDLISAARNPQPSEASTKEYLGKGAERLVRQERDFLEGMDRLVFQLERESNLRANRTIFWQRALVAALLIAVGGQGGVLPVLVVRTSSRAARRIAELEAELAAVRQLRDRTSPAAGPGHRPSTSREIVLPRRVEPVAAVA
jgi:hypothetical protein